MDFFAINTYFNAAAETFMHTTILPSFVESESSADNNLIYFFTETSHAYTHFFRRRGLVQFFIEMIITLDTNEATHHPYDQTCRYCQDFAAQDGAGHQWTREQEQLGSNSAYRQRCKACGRQLLPSVQAPRD